MLETLGPVQRILSLERRQVLGKKIWDLIGSDVPLSGIGGQGGRDGPLSAHRVELTTRRPDGTLLHLGVLLLGSPREETRFLVRLRIPEPSEDLVDFRSVSHARMVELENREAVERVTRGLTHDLCNLATAVEGFLEQALQRPHDPEWITRHLEPARKASEQATILLRQLLQLGVAADSESVGIGPDSVIEELRPLLECLPPDEVNLRLDLGAEGAWLMVDPTRIGQAVTNLVLNAAEAMNGQGTIVIRTRHESETGRYVLQVRDEGPGIPDPFADQIFSPTVSTKSEEGRPRGIGLSWVAHIVRQAGGSIELEESSPAGSVFRIELPAVPAEEAREDLPENRSDDGTDHPAILLVEDDEKVRNLLSAILEGEGYRVSERADGESALSAFQSRTEGFELVVADVGLPHLDGLELAARLRELSPRPPILLISGHPKVQGSSEGLPPNVSLLPKPIRPAELLQAVRQVLTDG